jgi:RES domain-containing protein
LIHTSDHYSTALLEKLAHGIGRLPPNQHYVEITLPAGLFYEVFSPPTLPGRDSMPATLSKEFGERERSERRSAILLVPSIVAWLDHNVLINPAHPEFAMISQFAPTGVLGSPVFLARRSAGHHS